MFDNVAPELIWFFLGLVLLLGELAIPAFVLMFFGIGAWVAALCTLLGIAPGINSQLLIFLGTSVLSLVLFRKKGKQLARGRVSENVQDVPALDELKGSHGTVVEAIEPQTLTGKVELHGTNWTAISDVAIPKGTPVRVVGRDNLTLRVKPLS